MNRINIKKPKIRWLFGGIGFQNSEATMLRIMSDKVKNEIALKTFRELSPTFSRVFIGYADWSKEAMDAFADYYDITFRNSGTLLYAVPGRMPMFDETFDMEEYSEKVASNFEYLIKERKCTKIRYYCVTNELSVGNSISWLAKRLDTFKKLHEHLHKAFKKHGLNIGLLATDCAGASNFGQIQWAADNMDEVTECYCAHLYSGNYKPGDIDAYDYFKKVFSGPVRVAQTKEKRFILGEFGIFEWEEPGKWPMRKDGTYSEQYPEEENIHAIALCELAVAAINTGCLAGVMWTMIDYPDPFLKEDGDTPEEKARFDVARYSGHGIDFRYNKHGLIRWSDDEEDYTSRASLYTMGYMAKLFRKGSRVLEISDMDDKYIRCAAVTNPDKSVSVVIINWEDKAKEVEIDMEHTSDKPFRKYEYSADSVPYNKFNDLQSFSEVVEGKKVKLLPRSVTFLTTDYVDRKPSKIKNILVSDGILSWDECKDSEHCYYRVFASDKKRFTPCYENQIASTVSTSLEINSENLYYKVLSVDKFGNV